VEDDDVELWRVEADQRHARAQADGHAQCCDLNL
jgi:hypothetical protein